MRTLSYVLLILALTGVSSSPYPWWSDTVTVDIRTVGSVPPVTRWYACAAALEDKPFNQPEVDKCLKSILANAPFLSGGAEREEGAEGSTIVVFNLTAPALPIRNLDWGAPSELRESLEAFLRTDPDTLQLADTYDYQRDSHTLTLYNLFLRAHGLRGIVSRDLTLDYQQRKANLRYKLWQGPQTFPEQPMPPYGKACDVMVRNLSETDVDDSTPLPLIESVLHFREKACFSSAQLEQAEDELRATGLFSSLSVSITGTGQWRDLVLKARAKSTVVGEVQYKFYGLLTRQSADGMSRVPLSASKAYSRSDALASQSILRKALMRENLKIQIYEQDETDRRGELVVIFHVLGAPGDSVKIDGVQVQN